MGFTSFIFPFFLLIVVTLYYALPQKYTWVMLLLASWFFYGYANLQVFFLLPAFSLVTWISAIYIEKTENDELRKVLFIGTLIVIFLALFVFKYLGLFVQTGLSFASLMGVQIDEFTLNIVLPVGISFYTFQTASYVIDIYLGKAQAEKNFGYYALFVSFFPQLVAGPIERINSLMPQLKKKNAFDGENIRRGIAMMTAGYIKKIFVADVIAGVVDAVYNSSNIEGLSAISVIVASALFFIQIYCDFSGYSDIAVGTAKLIGIDLMKNFNRPFAAESVAEFWSRWHISLSDWFNEYLYKPLAFQTYRKKNRNFYHCVNTLIVMLLSGFWHGAEWSYLLWGGLLATYQIIEVYLKKQKNESKIGKCLRKVKTYALLTLSMVLFRASNILTAGALYARMIVGWDPVLLGESFTQLGLTIPYIAIIATGIVLMSIVDRTITDDNAKTIIQKKSGVVVLASALLLIFFVWSYLVANGQETSFIYFQF